MRKPLLLSFAVLLSISLTAGATTFGPEVPVAPPSYSSAYGGQLTESVASDGESFVALWSESVHYARLGLYSSVIDANGVVHPASSNLLRSGLIRGASIVWTGDHYLATWGDNAIGAVVAAPIGRDGRISGEIRIVAANTVLAASNTLAWNGRHAFVAYQDNGGVAAAVLDADGRLLHTVSLAAAGGSVYSVAAAGSTFAIVTAETRFVQALSPIPQPTVPKTNVYFQRFDEGGAAIDAQPITLDSDLPVTLPRVAMGGNASQFGVAYLATDGGSIQRIRIDAATGAIERLAVTVLTPELDGVFWSGDDFVAYASFLHSLETLPFTSLAGHNMSVSPSSISRAVIGRGGNSSLAIWIDNRNADFTYHVFGALLDRDATAVTKGDLAVSLSGLPQMQPVLAASPNGALLVWIQEHSGGVPTDVFAKRLDAAGHPLDAAPIAVTSVSGSAVSASWLGNVYLVAWTQYDGPNARVVGKRISASGVVLDSTPVVFATGAAPVFASNGTTSLIAFVGDNKIEMVRLNADGVALDSQPVTIASRPGYNLAAAGNDSELLVLWTEGSNYSPGPLPPPNARDIYGVRLSATGQPIDAAPISIGSGLGDQANPVVASDGRDFLIAYTDGGDVAFKKLLREGSLASGTSEEEGTVLGGEAYSPRVAFIGMRYVITWSRYASYQWTALSASVDPSGTVLEPGAEITRSDSLFDVQTTLAAFHGTGLLAYSRGNAGDQGMPRVFTRQILNAQARARAVRH
jgi:hypothetical protein